MSPQMVPIVSTSYLRCVRKRKTCVWCFVPDSVWLFDSTECWHHFTLKLQDYHLFIYQFSTKHFQMQRFKAQVCLRCRSKDTKPQHQNRHQFQFVGWVCLSKDTECKYTNWNPTQLCTIYRKSQNLAVCGWLARDREGCTRHKDFPFQITEFLCNDSHWLLDKQR